MAFESVWRVLNFLQGPWLSARASAWHGEGPRFGPQYFLLKGPGNRWCGRPWIVAAHLSRHDWSWWTKAVHQWKADSSVPVPWNPGVYPLPCSVVVRTPGSLRSACAVPHLQECELGNLAAVQVLCCIAYAHNYEHIWRSLWKFCISYLHGQMGKLLFGVIVSLQRNKINAKMIHRLAVQSLKNLVMNPVEQTWIGFCVVLLSIALYGLLDHSQRFPRSCKCVWFISLSCLPFTVYTVCGRCHL